MDISNIPTGSFELTDHYDSRNEIESKAPKGLGSIAVTKWATYIWDSNPWVVGYQFHLQRAKGFPK